jgi:hypothetical protein
MALDSLRQKIRQFFLLADARRKHSALAGPQLTTVRAYHRAGQRQVLAAQQLRSQSPPVPAVSLYRQGALLLVLAFLAYNDKTLDPTTLTAEAAFDTFRAKLEAHRIELPPEFDRVRSVLVGCDILQLERLSAEEAGQKAEELESLTDWLSSLVDPRSPRELKNMSIVRIGGVSAGAAALLVYLSVRLFSAPNVALHKSVVAVSQDYNTTPAGVVDGNVDGRFGFHSALDDSPWLWIDLGRNYAIYKIKVYGRGDCCFDQSIPLALEVSSDGVSYSKIAEKTDQFSEVNPWVIHPTALVTRYVRLRTERRSYLALGEVEVFGRPPK